MRQRANAYLYTPDNAAGQDAFRRVIRDERSRELCFEGLRKYDLIRWGIFIETMKDVAVDIEANAPNALRYTTRGYDNVSSRDVLLPIPSRELTLNKSMTQNPDW